MFWNERKSLPQIYTDAQNNNHLQEEDNKAIIAGFSSALTCKKHQVFGLEKNSKILFLMIFW